MSAASRMKRRAFIFCPVFAAIATLVRRLRINPPPPEPRHLYAIRGDLDGNQTARVYVSTSAERALRSFRSDGYGFTEAEVAGVHEIPDGQLVRYVDAAGLLCEAPAALLARESPLVDVCIFDNTTRHRLWSRVV